MKDEMQIRDRDDEQLELALRNFRASVHGWSEQEYSRARAIKRSPWDAVFRTMAHPVMAWTLASALVMVSVGVPVTVHQQRQAEVERDAAMHRQQELEKAAADRQAAEGMTDDELLDHVDSDIAQAAPDAMQPLASMMTDSGAK